MCLMIASLKLENFRCFRELSLSFESPRVILAGSNGQGKTSILESIFFLANLRSFRTSRIQELYRIGSSSWSVKSRIRRGSYEELYEIEQSSVRRLRIGGKNIPRSSDFAGAFNTIAFLPDDPQIVTGPSLLRRRFFDMFISMMDREYFRALQKYSQALRERNALLRCENVRTSVIEAWDGVLSSFGSQIITLRHLYSSMLSDFMCRILTSVRPELSNFTIRMRSGKGLEKEAVFKERLKNQFLRDKMTGFTGFGPHMDDFEFIADGKPLRTFGSRGQCRIVSLAMKLAELDIVASLPGGMRSSVVLIDDATGDLDRRARDSFYERTMSAGQIFHAVTDASDSFSYSGTQIIPVAGDSHV